VHEKSVYEGQKAVDVIQRRTPISIFKMEGLFLSNDQMIKDAEIGMSGIPFNPSQHIQLLLLIQGLKHLIQTHDRVPYFFLFHLARMVPETSLQDSTAIGDLSGENELRHLRRKSQIICPAILLPAEKNIS
jgi:hypothetical protein